MIDPMNTSTDEYAQAPIILGIEMSNPSANSGTGSDAGNAVALWSSDEGAPRLLGSCPMPKGARGSDGIMSVIAGCCGEHGVVPESIGTIIVSIGPGGYTALRIATTTAKVLASTLGARLLPVPTARVAACAAAAQTRPLLVALASKKDHTHASIVDGSGHERSVGVITAEDLESLGVRAMACDQHLPDSIRERAEQLGIELLQLTLDATALLAASSGIDPVEPRQLAPRYAREPDAVTQWRARKGG